MEIIIQEIKQKVTSCIFSIEKFTMIGVEVKGVLVCDKSGSTISK